MPDVGRPTDYSPEVLQKAKTYIQLMVESNDIPFVEELSYLIGKSRQCIYEWAQKHEEFGDTIKMIENLQRLRLQKGSLKGEYNPASAIFQLKANHGMIETEKRIQEVTATIYTELPDEQLDALIEQKTREIGVTRND